ncbi:heme biosynthesis HemY N-terminal domain-containing protein [Siccirubricoccus deserti]
MRRAITILLLLGLGVALALWLAEVGGTVEIKVGDAWIGTSFPVALLILVLAFLVLHGVLSGISALRRWPERIRARRAARRRADGDAAVTRVLVALAAGTADAARLEVRKARNLLGDTPQTLLLAAEAERASGREEAAAEVFRALASREDSASSACAACCARRCRRVIGTPPWRWRRRPRRCSPARPGCGRSGSSSRCRPAIGGRPWRWPRRRHRKPPWPWPPRRRSRIRPRRPSWSARPSRPTTVSPRRRWRMPAGWKRPAARAVPAACWRRPGRPGRTPTSPSPTWPGKPTR